MIAKGKAISHGGNAIDYAMREGKIESIVGRNMIDSSDPAHIIREFEMVNQHNYRCKNKYLRFEIGIAPQDKDKLTREDMMRITQKFASKMSLHNHQWIACTHKDTGKPHIHLIANRIGVDGKVFDTTFMSNRSARIAEEISREMGLTIAKEVRKQETHKETYVDPARQKAKEKLQQVAYSELYSNKTLKGFLYVLERRGVGIEPAKNKQDKIYGIRFTYEGHTFKASEIGREFGYHSIAKNFTSSQEQSGSQSKDLSYSRKQSDSQDQSPDSHRDQEDMWHGEPYRSTEHSCSRDQEFSHSSGHERSHSQPTQYDYDQNAGSYQHSYSGSNSGIGSLLSDLFTSHGGGNLEEEDYNQFKRKKKKKKYHGPEF